MYILVGTSDLSTEQLEVVRFSESLLLEVSIQFSKCLTSAIEGLLCCVCMKGVCLVISPCNASGSREKKNGVGMVLDVATLSLILYRKVYTH